MDYAAETAKLPFTPEPAYPKVIKFLERHDSAADAGDPATCRQVRIVNNQAIPLIDSAGNPIVVQIQEYATSWEADGGQKHRRRSHGKAFPSGTIQRHEVLELTDCGCLWMST